MSQARAKRNQYKTGFRHIGKIGRPIFKKKSVETQKKRLMRLVAGERLRSIRKGLKKL